jgi:hypothetical protein
LPVGERRQKAVVGDDHIDPLAVCGLDEVGTELRPPEHEVATAVIA